MHAGRGVLALCLTASAISAPAHAGPSAKAGVEQPADTPGMGATIPFEKFTLGNGLRVIVATDKSLPIIAVGVFYDVGSKHEPMGKSGFAHLYEHLMFTGSVDNPGDFLAAFRDVGASGVNGQTTQDDTAYFETVPTGALERTLFLESDRMGHFLPAFTQSKLDAERGVVQNEKRYGDLRPAGLAEYKRLAALFPDNAYGHSPIGSMADLDAASLDTVKGWFRDHYGPNNAVLVLSGDVDAATARPLVEKYFGDIARGPRTGKPVVAIPTLAAPRTEILKDKVSDVTIEKSWAVPGLDNPDSSALTAVSLILGSMDSSRMDQQLVRGDGAATSVSASYYPQYQAGVFTLRATAKPGFDAAILSKKMDEIVATFVKGGPTRRELGRAQGADLLQQSFGLERASIRARILSQGELATGDPAFYKTQAVRRAGWTPASVRAVAAKWLSRPTYTLRTEPGEREPYPETTFVAKAAPADVAPPAPIRAVPPIAPTANAVPPGIARAQLSNGIEIFYLQKPQAPLTYASFVFDGGSSADPRGKSGAAWLTLQTLTQGSATKDADALAGAWADIGAMVLPNINEDQLKFDIVVPSAKLVSATNQMAEILRRPALSAADMDRLRAQQIRSISDVNDSPEDLASAALAPLIHGPDSPYAKTQFGTLEDVQSLSLKDLSAFRGAWVRPEALKIVVVSNLPLATIRSTFEQALGSWHVAGVPGKVRAIADKPVSPRIVVIDRPGSVQSVISGGISTSLTGHDDLTAFDVANDTLGGSYLSRLNLDLRVDKHWTYGVGGEIDPMRSSAPYDFGGSIQTDKTGPALLAMQGDLKAIVTDKPITQQEFDDARHQRVGKLASSFEAPSKLLVAIKDNLRLGRADDYYQNLSGALTRLTLADARGAMQNTLRYDRAIWVIVGDASKVVPQLKGVGLPVTIIKPDAK